MDPDDPLRVEIQIDRAQGDQLAPPKPLPVLEPHGERPVRMSRVVERFEHVAWEVVKDLDETARGDGGFGSTGKD